MKKNVSKILALLLACIMVFALVGCGADKAEEKTDAPAANSNSEASFTPGGKADFAPSSGSKTEETASAPAASDGPKILNVSTNGDDGTLSPAHNTSNSRVISNCIFEPLWEIDNFTNEVRMVLVEEAEIVSDTEWILHLKKDVKFSNGNPFTADDVIFTMKLFKGLGGLAAARVQTVDTEKSYAIDDYTVDVILLSPTIINWTVLQAVRVYDAESYSDDTIATDPVGTGPYKVAEYVPGSSCKLVPNELWWGGEPPCDEINFHVIAEDSQRINALETGMIDLTSVKATDSEYAASLPGVTVFDFYSGSYQIMNVNFSPTAAFWQNKDARHAVCYAMNREAMLQAVYEGKGRVMTACVPEYMQDFEERFANQDDTYAHGYDPELARQIAESSGLVNKNVRLVTNGSATSIQQSEMLQAMLKDIGVTSEIFNYDNATSIALLRGIDNPWDLFVSSGASPNRRCGDLLVNSTRSRDDICMEGSWEGNQEYLKGSPDTLALSDEQALSDSIFKWKGIYEDEVLSYGVVDNKAYVAWSDKIDPDSVWFGFASAIPDYAKLALK